MLSPQDQQQLADALDEARCSDTCAALGALVFQTRPDLTARLATMPFNGKPQKTQTRIRARADVLMMINEMGIEDQRLQRCVVAKLHYSEKITATVDKVVTGDGLPKWIRAEALEIKKLICAKPDRKAKRLEVLRAAIQSKSLD